MSIADTIIWLHETKMRNRIPSPEVYEFERRMAELRRRWFREAFASVDLRPSPPMADESKKTE